MESVKQALLGHMVSLLTSNKRLQNDLLCTQYRMEEQAQEIDYARREARTDALTSVANRKAFEERFHLLLSARSRPQRPFVLMMVDLDHLKRINDAHGHQAGDLVLEKTGRRLKQWVREGDFVARYGGDEFVLLLPRTELAAGVEIAQSICFRAADQASRVTFRGEQVSVSLSIGVTVSGVDDDTADDMLRRADRALYRSKHMGRNQVQFEAPAPAGVLAPFDVAADSGVETFPSLHRT
jgi:diguanylate cyclase